MSDLLKSVTEIDDIDFLFPKCKPKSHSQQREEILNENYNLSIDSSSRNSCDVNLNTDECTDDLLHSDNLNSLKNRRYSDSSHNGEPKIPEICKLDICDRVRRRKISGCNNKRRCQHNHQCGTYDLTQTRKFKRKHKSNETLDSDKNLSLMIPFTKMEYDSSLGGDEDSGQFENSGSNGSSSTTFSETNIPFSGGLLRDSRIEIAGGREIFSQNKIRVGGRSRWKGNTGTSERESDLLECTSSTLHGNIKPKRKCSSKSHGSSCCINPESPSVWEFQQTRGKNHFNYIECCNHNAIDLHQTNYPENEHGDCKLERSYHSCHCSYAPHPHLLEEFPPCAKGLHHQHLLERDYSVPKVHGTRKNPNSLVTLKETVFGSEVTSIEKPLPFRGEQLSFKGQGISTSESSSQTSIPPYFYGCRSPAEGEVVFDDIEEWQRVREIEDFAEQEFLRHPKYTVPLQPVKMSQGTSNCVTNKVSRSSNVDSPGLGEGNSSPSGYESDECERSVSQHNLKSAQLSKQLIGNLPIAEYEGSPKRYGLSKPVPCGERVEGVRTNPKDNLNILDLTTDQPQNLTNNSEVNIFTGLPRSVPGFPQRVINRRRRKSIEKESQNITGLNLSDSGQQTMEDMPASLSLSANSTEYILSSQQESLPNESTPIKSSSIENHDIPDPLYEFSETRKVLEEFFQPLLPQNVPETQSAEFDELEYTLKRQSGNSYVGHRLATDIVSELKSPNKSPNDDKGEGSSPKLISFTEESNLSDESAFRNSNKNVNEIKEELACTDKARGNIEEVLVEQSHNTNRKFTMSPESTDCDSNELESEVSLDYEISVHSSSRMGQVMPILEDGLSSGNVSETDDIAKQSKPLEHWKNSGSGESEVNKYEVGDGNANSLMKKQVSEIEQDSQAKTVEPKQNELGNPSNHSLSTLQLTSDPRFELDFKETLLQSENQDGSTSNGVFDSNDPELEALDPMRPTPPPSPAPGPGYKLPNNCKPLANQYAIDSNSLGTNPGISASLEAHLSSFSGLQLSSFTQQYSTKPGLIEQEQPFNSCTGSNSQPYNPTTKFSSNPNPILPNLMSSNLDYLNLNDSQLCSSNEDLTSHERTSSPVWIPRRPLLRRSDNNGRHGDTTYGVRDPLIRKSARYTELIEDENDTDQETDRLLGQHRTEDDCGFYDENEWKDNSRHSLHSCTASKSISSFIKPNTTNNRPQATSTPRLSLTSTSPNRLNLNSPTAEQAYDENDCLSSCPKSMKDKDVIKKKRNKEELKNNPSVLIEGVLFRARYLGSTQLVTEGQPTKATRMLQAEEAVSRIKPLNNQNGLNSASSLRSPSTSFGNNNSSSPIYINTFNATNNESKIHPRRNEDSPIRTEQNDKCICGPLPFRPYLGRYNSKDLIGFDICDESFQSPNDESEKSQNSFCSVKCGTCNQLTKRLSLASTISPPSPSQYTPSACSAISGTLFHLRYLGSIEVEDENSNGKQRRKKTKKTMVEEAVALLKAPEGESQPSTEVDLFISTEKIMVLNTDLKEIMIDNTLRTISYIADIGDLVVLMARRRIVPTDSQEDTNKIPRPPKMICHVFESEEAQYIAQSIGQAFQVAYMEFLKANGIEDHSFVREMDYQEVLNSQEIFGDELQMFAKKERQKDVVVPKAKGEILGVVIVESGWGSMLPTVVIANLAPAGAAARCGQLNIGDQIIAINGVSLVGLPLSTCQTYIKNSKNQTVVKLTVVPCPPVVEVKIKRPDTKYQLGFSVQNGVICSLLRGGIAERGGVRVGHRIIEINNQSVVAVPHEKIVNLLATSVGEINMKTMPTSMFRLLTGQETPLHI